MSKESRSEYNKKYRELNREKILEKAREYRSRPHVILSRKNWRDTNKDRTKANYLKNREHIKFKKININYGLSKDEYNSILVSQKQCCGICLNKLVEGNRSIHVDHNHKTKSVRGILCRSCNLMLGYAKDNVKTLLSAIKYIERYD